MTDRFQIVLCKPPGCDYAESVRETMECVAESLGLRERIGINALRPGLRPIVFCPQHLDAALADELPDDAILYNLEQLRPGYPWHRDDYLGLLRRFKVWDGSARNVAYLRDSGIAPAAIHVPIGYSPCLTRIPKQAVEDVDVLFYGVPTERRMAVLRAIGDAGLKAVALDNVWGAERDNWIARAKVVLNLHAADGGGFEAARVLYLLANRKAVVTESFGAGEIDVDLQGGLAIAPYSRLATECLRLVRNEELRRAIEENGYRAITAPLRRMHHSLERALTAAPKAPILGAPSAVAEIQPARRRILLLGHGGGSGGAESLLIELAAAWRDHHDIVVALPAHGESVSNLQRADIDCRLLPTPWWTPNFAACADDALRNAVARLRELIRNERFELVVSNTGVIPAGALAAFQEGIPHAAYLLEDFSADPDLMPDACSGDQLVRFVGALADEIWCPSPYMAHKLAVNTVAPIQVLPPFFRYSGHGRDRTDTRPCLIFVNVLNHRKNPDLFVDTLDYLRNCGLGFSARIFGLPGNAAQLVTERIAQAGLDRQVAVLGTDAEPLAYVPEHTVLVQTAGTEPFGLIVGEALRRGIPVVTTPSGGPAEIVAGMRSCRVTADFTAEAIGDAVLDLLADVDATYAAAARDAETLLVRHSPVLFRSLALERATGVARRQRSAVELEDIAWIDDVLLDAKRKLRLDETMLTDIVAHCVGVAPTTIRSAIDDELAQPGTTMNNAFAAIGAPVHFATAKLTRIYRESAATAIELAATMNEPERLAMLTYIATRLREHAASHSRAIGELRVLALGDGIGSDALRLLQLGFRIDYADLPDSVTYGIAVARMATYIDSGQATVLPTPTGLPGSHYDAIISLEVLEHLTDPWQALRDIAHALVPGGLAFVSECFACNVARYPTHLTRNARLSGTLPALCAATDLWLTGYNRLPPLKPYEFVKGPVSPEARLRALLDPVFRQSMAVSYSIDTRRDFAWRHVIGMPASFIPTTKEASS